MVCCGVGTVITCWAGAGRREGKGEGKGSVLPVEPVGQPVVVLWSVVGLELL